MGKLQYMIRRIKEMDKRAMLDVVDDVANKTNRNKFIIFCDAIWCGLRHQAGYVDYRLFEMYNLTEKQRKTYLTRGRNNQIVKKYNQKDAYIIFEDKERFNQAFGQYLKRDWIALTPDNKLQALEWMLSKKAFFVKPTDGSCGKGIEKYTTDSTFDKEALSQIIDRLLSVSTHYLLEEAIIQHPVLSNIYPHSVNTIRAVTVLKDGVAYLVQTYIRLGHHGNFVDNFNSGGMTAPIDVKTGIIKAPAIDKQNQLYTVHPYTNAQIQGVQLPDWQRLIDLCKSLATVVPEMGYIGWDISLTEDGPVIVEANEYPGHDIYQLPGHTPDKIGVYESFLYPEKTGV